MKEFVEKLIGRLEEKAKIEGEKCDKFAEMNMCESVVKYNHGEYCYIDAISIVNQLAEEYKPKTNADRIRAMSDEELAEFLESFEACTNCEYMDGTLCTFNNPCVHEFATAMIFKWLQGKGD